MQLVFDKVSASYNSEDAGQERLWALADVTLEVREGDFLGIAGPTGSGKTTLLQHMNGLLRPTKGCVLANGKNLAEKKNARKLRGSVGLVFQYPEKQLFAASVLEDVAFGPRNKGIGASQAHAQAKHALEMVGLDPEEIGKASPFALSGGQQRRVALAGTLAMGPKILVLDEPAAGLDPKAHDELILLIKGLNEQGITIVMASHDMDDLAACCTRMVVLDQGRIVLSGTPAEVFSCRKAIEDIGLELPFAQRLAEDLNTSGVKLPRAFYPTIEHLVTDLATL